MVLDVGLTSEVYVIDQCLSLIRKKCILFNPCSLRNVLSMTYERPVVYPAIYSLVPSINKTDNQDVCIKKLKVVFKHS